MNTPPRPQQRLRVVASALLPGLATATSAAASSARRPSEPEWDSAGDGAVDDGAAADSNANLTLEEQLFVFDLQGFLVVEDVLPPGRVDELNALIDAQGIAPGEPEVLADGSSGSRVRFGSAGGGARNIGPGLLSWGQPFVDLLDDPAVTRFLAALIPSRDGLGTGGGKQSTPNVPLIFVPLVHP